MLENRLSESFTGFDSIYPRMERVPNDLNDDKIREEYLANHIKWFLKNHSGAEDLFNLKVEKKYGSKSNLILPKNNDLLDFQPPENYVIRFAANLRVSVWRLILWQSMQIFYQDGDLRIAIYF